MKSSIRAAVLALSVASFSLFAGCPPFGPSAGTTRTFDGIQFQWCPPGTFAMGSPGIEAGHTSDETLHEVTISNGFWLSRYEVTQAQWNSVVGQNPSEFPGNNRPVENVTWHDVQDFLTLLNVTSWGSSYRLPTEAEWEYACRAGTTTRYYWGNDPAESMIDDYAWYWDTGDLETHPVGEKTPNAWGLYDMIGNVFEWCQDRYGQYPENPVTDPAGPNAGNSRVVRGGSWDSFPEACRSAARDSRLPNTVSGDLGFRLVRVAK